MIPSLLLSVNPDATKSPFVPTVTPEAIKWSRAACQSGLFNAGVWAGSGAMLNAEISGWLIAIFIVALTVVLAETITLLEPENVFEKAATDFEATTA